jgi:hypothetical protein
MSLRDDILNSDDLTHTPVFVPEWTDAELNVRTMTGRERTRISAAIERGDPQLSALYARISVVDANGDQVFTDKDIPALANKSGVALERVLKACIKVNSLNGEAVDDAEKNSETIPNDGRGTA